MSTLPQGWDFDYDGTRWFYQYKPTGHIQYHFPSEGDEFPDFIDATSAPPPLAPEERLESQRQQGRRHGQNLSVPTSYGSRGLRGKEGMSATARPVSNVLEDEPSHVPFQPESFLYLGPGSYTDVSPLMEEGEDEDAAARRVVAGSSAGSSMLTPATKRSPPIEGQWALPAQSPRFSPHMSDDGTQQDTELDGQEMVHMLDGQEVIHMLDGREVLMELEGVTGFNPVGVVAEMGSRGSDDSSMEGELVEMPAGNEMAPVEKEVVGGEGTARAVESGLREMEESSTMTSGSSSDQTQTTQPHAVRDDAAPKHFPDLPVSSEQQPTSTFKIARKPTNGKYQPYKPSQTSDRPAKTSVERSNDNIPIRRDHSLMINSKSEGSQRSNVEPAPPSLALGHDQLQNKPNEQAQPTEDLKQGCDRQGLVTHPSVLNPAKKANRDSDGSSKTTSTSGPESPIDPAVESGQEAAGVTKFPSVLKPARGRAPSIPPKPSSSWPVEDAPKKSYQQRAVVEEGDMKYVPYTQPHRGDQSLNVRESAQRPFSDVQPTIEEPPTFPQEVRPANVMPVVETTPAPNYPPSEERHLPYRLIRANSSEVHQPTSISATPDGEPRPISYFEAIPSLAFASGGVPSPTSSDQTPPFSPKSAAGVESQKTASPEEVSPLRSRETSISSAGPQQTPSPVEALRRGSSVASHSQTHDGMSTWTPSPASETPPSASQKGLPQRKLSGLRHPIPDQTPEHKIIISPAPSTKTPVDSGPPAAEEELVSYFPRPESIQRLSLPYSLLEDSDEGTSPVAPTPPPKHPERQLQLQRSKSLQETKSPKFEEAVAVEPSTLETPPPLEIPPSQIQMGGHVLHAIEEDEEEPHEELSMARRVVLKRHSVSSGSVQMSPPRVKGNIAESLAAGSPRSVGQGQSVPHQRTVSQPVQSPAAKTPVSQVQRPRPQQAPVAPHQRTASQPVQPQSTVPGPWAQTPIQDPPPPANYQQKTLPPVPPASTSHHRALSQPVQFQTRQDTMPQTQSQRKHQEPTAPLKPQHVPQWQIPQGHYPTHEHHQPAPLPEGRPPWHIPMPPPLGHFGTTTQVSSPGQKDKERGWKKLFKKTPTRETAMISEPILTVSQMQHVPQMQYYMPAGQAPPGPQHPPRWASGAPTWQQSLPSTQQQSPLGNVQLPPAVGDRPGVSRIPGFEVADPLQRMATVRRHSALESNPFDANVMPQQLLDKETAPCEGYNGKSWT